MKGFVPTPERIVDLMVEKLFEKRKPSETDVILDAGCGDGAFIEGILRWCREKKVGVPRVVGVESNPVHVAECMRKFSGRKQISIEQRDYLVPSTSEYDYIISNPPYVPITKLSEEEKANYRRAYTTARGRFDLYILFFEQALRELRKGGRLVFITPEKYLYVETASELRRLIAATDVEEIRMIEEEAFGDLVTYPTITTLTKENPRGPTVVILRDGSSSTVSLPADGRSWLPVIRGAKEARTKLTLADVSLRVSCGVATGADSVFIKDRNTLDKDLIPYSRPTLSGREILPATRGFTVRHSMLMPYRVDGELVEEKDLGNLGSYLGREEIKNRLMKRTCVKRKPWYSFHENPPMADILRPKILCKDITEDPFFVVDRDGEIVPRHTVYYIVPKDQKLLEKLADYLNSEKATEWLRAHCQRAANGFVRVQSHVLKRLPVPREFGGHR